MSDAMRLCPRCKGTPSIQYDRTGSGRMPYIGIAHCPKCGYSVSAGSLSKHGAIVAAMHRWELN